MNEEGIDAALQDCVDKLKLFLGHQLRCHGQQTVFMEPDDMFSTEEVDTFAIATKENEMKYEPKEFRQKFSDWYGRKVFSWHETVVTFRPRETNDANATKRSGGSYKTRLTRNLCFDHVCRNERNQTAFSIASIMELFCLIVITELPTLKKAVLQSDNAANYSTNLVPVVAPLIFREYGIELCRILHSETQDEKGPADVHFATATRFVDRYNDSQSLDFMTPADLVCALNHGDDPNSTIAELFDIDTNSDSFRTWDEILKPGGKEGCLATPGRCNKIQYKYEDCSENYIVAKTYNFKYGTPIQWELCVGAS